MIGETRFGKKLTVLFGVCAMAFGLTACLGDSDPVIKAINDTLDVEFESFDVSERDIYPGEVVTIKWQSSGVFIFDARMYVSEDSEVSAGDVRVVDEKCSFDSDRHCQSGEDVRFECSYLSDNSFDCREDGDTLRRNDLSEFLDVLPKPAYIILQLCDNDGCVQRARQVTFH